MGWRDKYSLQSEVGVGWGGGISTLSSLRWEWGGGNKYNPP